MQKNREESAAILHLTNTLNSVHIENSDVNLLRELSTRHVNGENVEQEARDAADAALKNRRLLPSPLTVAPGRRVNVR